MQTIIDDEVHIWQANLKRLSQNPKNFSEYLSPNEKEKAERLKFTHDRDQYILRHYLLRLILCKYCTCQPNELIFRFNDYQKPFISLPQPEENKFNMSYSDDFMIVGISKQNDVGIDIEKVREISNLEDIAYDNFSQPELEYFNSEPDKKTAFFKIWTRKEAFIKAVGNGIYFPLKSFCIEIDPSGSYENLTIMKNPAESKLWKTIALKVPDNHIASLAVKSDRFKVLYFQ